MKDRVIQIKRVSQNSPLEGVAYWMSKSPEERFSAVEFLRRQWYETPPRLQRVFKIVQREGNTFKEIASGRAKDLADIEALGVKINK